MIYPKLTRNNYRRRGPFETKKYNNSICDLVNALNELKDENEIILKEMDFLEKLYSSGESVKIKTSFKVLQDDIATISKKYTKKGEC